MSRRKAAPKRKVLPDPKFHNELVAKFVSCLMISGKKSIAEKIIYSAFDKIAERLKIKAKDKTEAQGSEDERSGGILGVFEQVIDQVRPTVEVRSRRVGGATYQIPMEVRADRGIALAMRWIIQSARLRGEKGMVSQLAAEMIDAFEGKGAAVKKREDTHRMAKANQAFAHYRW